MADSEFIIGGLFRREEDKASNHVGVIVGKRHPFLSCMLSYSVFLAENLVDRGLDRYAATRVKGPPDNANVLDLANHCRICCRRGRNHHPYRPSHHPLTPTEGSQVEGIVGGFAGRGLIEG
jgi:hypothetical protein